VWLLISKIELQGLLLYLEAKEMKVKNGFSHSNYGSSFSKKY